MPKRFDIDALGEMSGVVHDGLTDYPKDRCRKLVAYVGPRQESVLVNELRIFRKETLTSYLVPTTLVTMEHLPLVSDCTVVRSGLRSER